MNLGVDERPSKEVGLAAPQKMRCGPDTRDLSVPRASGTTEATVIKDGERDSAVVGQCACVSCLLSLPRYLLTFRTGKNSAFSLSTCIYFYIFYCSDVTLTFSIHTMSSREMFCGTRLRSKPLWSSLVWLRKQEIRIDKYWFVHLPLTCSSTYLSQPTTSHSLMEQQYQGCDLLWSTYMFFLIRSLLTLPIMGKEDSLLIRCSLPGCVTSCWRVLSINCKVS